MDKIICSEFEDCLDCPFVRLKNEHHDAHCWLYAKSMVVKIGSKKPDFCKVESITVKERSK